MAAAFGEYARVAAQLFSHRDRRPEIKRERKLRPCKIFRSDTDHLVRAIIELDRLADDVLIGSHATLPETVAQNNNGISARRLVFVRQKRAAQDWFHLEHVEVVGGDDLSPDHVILVLSINRGLDHVFRGQTFERCALVAVFEEVRIGELIGYATVFGDLYG